MRIPRDRRAEGGIWAGHQGFGASVAPVPGGNASSFGGRGALRRERGDVGRGQAGFQEAPQSASPAPPGTALARRRCGYQLSALLSKCTARLPPPTKPQIQVRVNDLQPFPALHAPAFAAQTCLPARHRVCEPPAPTAPRPDPVPAQPYDCSANTSLVPHVSETRIQGLAARPCPRALAGLRDDSHPGSLPPSSALPASAVRPQSFLVLFPDCARLFSFGPSRVSRTMGTSRAWLFCPYRATSGMCLFLLLYPPPHRPLPPPAPVQTLCPPVQKMLNWALGGCQAPK